MSGSANDRSRRLRALPSVDSLLVRLGHLPGATAEIRAELDRQRREVAAGAEVPDEASLAERVEGRLLAAAQQAYPALVNATGTLLHTGLGRAPLAAPAVAALARADRNALVEVDAERGRRRHREHALLKDLCVLTGAEGATVVNNNAGALLLALHAVADGRPVLVSRGELIEIGGGFRLPELLALSGAPLVEVGTTNRTYVKDYARVLSWETGLVLVMHTSNYRIEGFTHAADLAELARLTGESAVPLLVDIGSGLLSPPDPRLGLGNEPDARSALAAGADLVCFSGDKLLGGPQAGVLVGRADLVARCRAHPLFRALRPDRLVLSALAATLSLHRRAPLDVPVLAALSRSPAEREQRALSLARELRRAGLDSGSPLTLEVVPSQAAVGSGSAPARPLSSWAVRVGAGAVPAEDLARRLRLGDPSVFARVWRGQLQLDVAALLPGDEQRLTQALCALAAAISSWGAPTDHRSAGPACPGIPGPADRG